MLPPAGSQLFFLPVSRAGPNPQPSLLLPRRQSCSNLSKVRLPRAIFALVRMLHSMNANTIRAHWVALRQRRPCRSPFAAASLFVTSDLRDRCQPVGIASTGQGARRKTCSVVLPRRASSHPSRPAVGIAIMSVWRSWAMRKIVSSTGPWTTWMGLSGCPDTPMILGSLSPTWMN